MESMKIKKKIESFFVSLLILKLFLTAAKKEEKITNNTLRIIVIVQN